ncbi:MAG: tRNA (adenosine(37)-N6)-dimethylallyltransferase MiaA [Leptospirillia bacterium]
MVRPLEAVDLVIAGPTASGKSRMALTWARANDGEIVSVDSRQIYREISVGTGKPSLADRDLVPHHLIDICPIREPYSAGAFVRDARRAIGEIQSRGKRVVLCGGTGLYLRSLLDGIVSLPERPGSPDIEGEEVRRRMEAIPTAALYERLAGVDPLRAESLHPGDRVRLLRALFLYDVYGLPPTELYRRYRGEGLSFRTFLVLSPERSLLYEAIGRRVEEMLSAGWIGEVEELLSFGADPASPGFDSLGYREVVEHLAGRLTREELQGAIVLKTRQYAKRQVTWFRHMRGAVAVDPEKTGLIGDPGL